MNSLDWDLEADTTGESYPMSPLQMGMLSHALRDSVSGVDVEQVLCVLPELVNVPALKAAWAHIISRHTILRTVFRWQDVPQPSQYVLKKLSLPWVDQDLRSLPSGTREAELKLCIQRDRLAGFNLAVPPLLRFSLFRLGNSDYRLLWTFHHALLDGRSFPLLLQEVFTCYEALQEVRRPQLPPTRPYREFINWLANRDHSASMEYWKGLLSRHDHPTPLGIEKCGVVENPESKPGADYAECQLRISETESKALQEFAARNGITPNTLIQGAWALLLSRYGGDEEVVFGATRACRAGGLADAAQRVGLFINTLPVRVHVKPEQPVMSWLQELRASWVAMRPHEHTPLSQVRSWSRMPAGMPLFDTIVVVDNASLDGRMKALGGAWSRRSVEYMGQTNFPLTVMAYLDPSWLMVIGYYQTRFAPILVQRMLGHLRVLMLEMMAHPDAKLSQLSILSPEERHELIQGFNTSPAKTTHRSPFGEDTTLSQIFEEQVRRAPESIALVCDGQSLTYAELNRRANRLARHLQSLGVGPEILVGLCMERSNDLVVALLAILKAGGAYLSIDLAYPADRLAFMLSDARAPVLITQEALLGKLPETSASVICVDAWMTSTPSGRESVEADQNLESGSRADDLAYVIYTSGTTGKPKGSLITHRNVVRLFTQTDAWFGFGSRDVWSLFHSYAFDFSVWEIWGALLYGGRLVVVPFLVSRSPEQFYELVAREGVTVLNQTPSAFRQFVAAEEAVGQKSLALRYVVFGGEALEMQSLRPWYDRHDDRMPTLINMYGITETTVHVTYRPLSRNDLRSGSVIGIPIPDLQVYIVDRNLQPTPVGVAGEMYVGGGGLARGYLRRPELTAERFPPDTLTGNANARLYKTGDLARFIPGGDIEYLGRIDHQVKIRGFRIELGEIESVLLQHGSVREAVVLAREDVPGDKRLAAYLVSSEPVPSVSELREHLKKQVPDYMVPAHFVFLDKLPLTNNGKVDRRALPVPEVHRGGDSESRHVAPVGEAEEKLAAIWSKVIRVPKVGRHDNFFELGGDSILSIQIISMARAEGLLLTPAQLFKHQTIAELAAVAVPIAVKGARDQGLVQGQVPWTPIMHWFFEQALADSHYYNQSFLFECRERLDDATLRAALLALERHHDVLRLRFPAPEQGTPSTPVAKHGELSSAPLLERVDFAHVDDAELAAQLEAKSVAVQGALDPFRGPLWRVVYFDLGLNRRARLLIAIHHLAVDGVSWRILIEDLAQACRAVHERRPVTLPSKTTSFQEWAAALPKHAASPAGSADLSHWLALSKTPFAPIPTDAPLGENSEGSADTWIVKLDRAETEALLQRAHGTYRTQINDLLLSALVDTACNWTRRDRAVFNVEGHGREDVIEGVDLSRTVGWFTTIYPVELVRPAGGPAVLIPSVKEQLRRVPQRGFGFGLHRYLSQVPELRSMWEPDWVFNYLGQFDQVVAGSGLLAFAAESTGPWHSPKGRRRHRIEVNCLVRQGCLEIHWTYSRNLHRAETIEMLAAGYVASLRSILVHCLENHVRGATPSDFPLVQLDTAAIQVLTSRSEQLEDVLPLSPIQSLFYTAAASNPGSVIDQWHCTLEGVVDPVLLAKAWKHVVQRHPILRSTFEAMGSRDAVQVVHGSVDIPWAGEDWSSQPEGNWARLWNDLLARDRAQGMALDRAPLMRFVLVKLEASRWKMLWTIPALLLDGWSWPLVFGEVSAAYQAFSEGHDPSLGAVRAYREYLEWLSKQSYDISESFWRGALKGVRVPTPLISEPPSGPGSGAEGSFAEVSLRLSPGVGERLNQAARQWKVTVNAIIQAAWSTVLSRLSGHSDVIFGAAFSGRPTDLKGSGEIVGPLVNNLPVRVALDPSRSGGSFVERLHQELLLLNPHQCVPLSRIQEWSEVSWQHRLFESLLVVQNYGVDDSARGLGRDVRIQDFHGPIHTNYPVLVLVEPADGWKLTLVYDRKRFTPETISNWCGDMAASLSWFSELAAQPLANLLETLTPRSHAAETGGRRARIASRYLLPPQNALERSIIEVWRDLFQATDISVEDNLFDLGAHSMLILKMHQRLKDALKRDFPLVSLFQFPTIQLLARHLGEEGDQGEKARGAQVRERAQLQREALMRMRQGSRRPPGQE